MDFHISYEANRVHQRTGKLFARIFSGLLGALQDQFAAADLRDLSPGYSQPFRNARQCQHGAEGADVPPRHQLTGTLKVAVAAHPRIRTLIYLDMIDL